MLGSHVQLMCIEYASKMLVGFTCQQIIMHIENVSAYAFYLSSHVKRFRCVLDECASANTHRILRVNEAYIYVSLSSAL